MACKVAQLDLPADDAAVLSGWMSDGTDANGRRVSADLLALALSDLGHSVGRTTLKDHRGGRCACYRKASA